MGQFRLNGYWTPIKKMTYVEYLRPNGYLYSDYEYTYTFSSFSEAKSWFDELQQKALEANRIRQRRKDNSFVYYPPYFEKVPYVSDTN